MVSGLSHTRALDIRRLYLEWQQAVDTFGIVSTEWSGIEAETGTQVLPCAAPHRKLLRRPLVEPPFAVHLQTQKMVASRGPSVNLKICFQ